MRDAVPADRESGRLTAMDNLQTTAPSDLNTLFSAVSRIEREGLPFAHSVKIAFLRNVTIEGLEAFLKFHLYPSSVRPEVVFGGYGTMVQDALAEDGLVQTAQADVIVLSLVLEELDPFYGTPGWRWETAQIALKDLFGLLESRTRATIAVNTFLPPLYPELGLVLPKDRSDAASQVADLNRFVADFVRSHAPRFCLTDWSRYLSLIGAEAALDQRGRYLWKAPFKKAFLDLYAQDIARIVRALKGGAKKCLVLDCDNTLWGGIVGEDGLDAIKLDRNEYPGKAFYDFQTSLLQVVERGVLVVLCSKNNEGDVFEVLEKHPACRLKRAHLSGWRINWRDKARNLVELSEELNLALDSFVFVDDSPVECELIRKLLPDVTVLQVPDKPYELPSFLLRQGLFDTISVTREDKQRARLYQDETERKSARNAFANVDEYLASLGTVATIHRVRPAEIARVAQLTQKTNQFNLTTRRYGEADIRAFADGSDAAVFTLSVADRFGDLGLVGVLILEREGSTGRIDTFLMSCRVLGRGLERAMIAHCLKLMGPVWNVSTWEGEYIPTRKNMQVADLWPKNGFVRAGSGERMIYVRRAEAEAEIPAHIRIEEG
jgi:FkbH-like protein